MLFSCFSGTLDSKNQNTAFRNQSLGKISVSLAKINLSVLMAILRKTTPLAGGSRIFFYFTGWQGDRLL
ncbi:MULTISPECIES: hypothetical protein [Spirulina sp. CCY15215]|uniref:hypothetical protein n=1 Tax=Spirulina sp. CCY15215 TaxID=2767591 RepID=UPI001951B71C|nr:hypothetical protein [Spirulina major]